MTDIDSMIAVLQAAKDGKVIQWRIVGCDDWIERPKVWDFQTYEYRVKPESEPFILELNVGLKPYGWTCSSGENANLELEFIDGKLVGAKVL